MEMAVAIFFGLLAAVLAVLAIMMQAPPEVAISNLAKWYGRFASRRMVFA
jgi:hypothetical protein